MTLVIASWLCGFPSSAGGGFKCSRWSWGLSEGAHLLNAEPGLLGLSLDHGGIARLARVGGQRLQLNALLAGNTGPDGTSKSG